MILIGGLQDPVRKMIPGVPGYLVLSTMPVWFSMIFKVADKVPAAVSLFRKGYKKLYTASFWFVLSLIPAAFLSATYGPGSWQVTIVGILSYGSLIMGIILGFMFPLNEKYIWRLFAFYSVFTAIMLIGTPLDYLNLAPGLAAVGDNAFNATWIQTSIYGVIVEMISGFYRSPDVMGWHSVMLSMIASLLGMQSRGGQRYFWFAIAGWGLVGAMLCGRRKMMYMLPVFAVVLFWLLSHIRSRRFNVAQFVAIVGLIVIIGGAFYSMTGKSTAMETYFFHNPNSISDRIEAHGFNAVIGTFRQFGFWGAGLGTATQGIQHLNVARPRTWQEGGLGRLFVELGAPGLICFFLAGICLIVSMWQLLTNKMNQDSGDFLARAGLFAIICSNGGSFIVSHQIFGDPFIMAFIAFLIGLILSGARFIETGTTELVF